MVKSIENYTVSELQNIAKSNKVRGTSKMRKKELYNKLLRLNFIKSTYSQKKKSLSKRNYKDGFHNVTYIGSNSKQYGKCIENIELSKELGRQNIELRKELGRGVKGTVFESCIEQNCKYVLKVVEFSIDPFEAETEIKELADEVEISKRAAKRNISPQIYGFWICIKNNRPAYGFIVMDMLNITLKSWLERQPDYQTAIKSIQRKLNEKLDNLHQEGIIHNDLSNVNVLLKLNGEPEPFLIDFGASLLKEDFPNLLEFKTSAQEETKKWNALLKDPAKILKDIHIIQKRNYKLMKINRFLKYMPKMQIIQIE